MVATNHSSIVLNCAANSTNGSDVEISWRKNGEALVPDGRQYILSPNGSLLIPSFSQQLNDKEMYECIAKSGSSALVSRQARLQVAGKRLVFCFTVLSVGKVLGVVLTVLFLVLVADRAAFVLIYGLDM